MLVSGATARGRAAHRNWISRLASLARRPGRITAGSARRVWIRNAITDVTDTKAIAAADSEHQTGGDRYATAPSPTSSNRDERGLSLLRRYVNGIDTA